MLCYVKGEIVVLTCKSNLKFLCSKVETILLDGTFSMAPKYFTQMYHFCGMYKNYYNPLVTVLLKDKTADTYCKMWDFFLELCDTEAGLVFAPKTALFDFEYAATNEFKKKCPDTKVKCCTFHLGQSFNRSVAKVGLSTEYKTNGSEVGTWLIYFLGLSFLEPKEVEDALN